MVTVYTGHGDGATQGRTHREGIHFLWWPVETWAHLHSLERTGAHTETGGDKSPSPLHLKVVLTWC